MLKLSDISGLYVLTVVLHDYVGRAEIEEPSDHVLVLDQMPKHLDEFLLALLRVDQVLVQVDYFVALRERLPAILLTHVIGEFVEVAGIQIDQFLCLGVMLT